MLGVPAGFVGETGSLVSEDHAAKPHQACSKIGGHLPFKRTPNRPITATARQVRCRCPSVWLEEVRRIPRSEDSQVEPDGTRQLWFEGPLLRDAAESPVDPPQPASLDLACAYGSLAGHAIPSITHGILDLLPGGSAAVFVAVPILRQIRFDVVPIAAFETVCGLIAVAVSRLVEL